MSHAPERSGTPVPAAIVVGAVVALCTIGGVVGIPGGEPEPAPVGVTAPLPAPGRTAKVAMPDVRGQDAAAAGEQLTGLGFTEVSFEPAPPQDCTVAEQSIAADALIPAGTPIVLSCAETPA